MANMQIAGDFLVNTPKPSIDQIIHSEIKPVKSLKNDKVKKTNLSFYASQKELDFLKEQSYKETRTMSQLVRKLIKDYAAQNGVIL